MGSDTDKVAADIPLEYVPAEEYTRVFGSHLGVKQGLGKFYSPEALEKIVVEAKEMGDELMKQGCSGEYAVPLSLLKLYDIVMLVDDSSSMNYAQKGERKGTLKKTMEEITKVYDLANKNGIQSIRFINAPKGRKNVVFTKVESVFENRVYNGTTMIGTALERKLLQPFVTKRKEEMTKPLLIMVVTDGMVEGEKTGLLKHVIVNCMDFLKAKPLDDAVAFHFCRVGNDENAMKMLQHLDNCKEVGQYVDCLPVDEPLEALTNGDLKWHILTKLLIGAIDPDFDNMTLNLGEEVEDVVMGSDEPADDDLEDDE